VTTLYYYLALLSAAVSVVASAAVFLRNRHQAVGPLFGMTMLVMAAWLVSFAQYFIPMQTGQALRWSQVTLTCTIILHVSWFHTLCALAGKMRRFRWWIIGCYTSGLLFLALLWKGLLITGLKTVPYMDHYVRYNREVYPALVLFIVFWGWLGAGIVAVSARNATGYKRTQLTYFFIAWVVVFLTTTSIILPLEYDINIQPFGLFILPINLSFLAYASAKARLVDYNVAIARVLLHTVTLVVVVAVSLLFIAGMAFAAPGFMNSLQIAFTVMLVVSIGLVLTMFLPRWLPRAERMMQERFFGKHYGYQDALAGLVEELSCFSVVDQVLDKVATTVHSQMPVSRVLIFIQDTLSGNYELHAQSGLSSKDGEAQIELSSDSAIVNWLEAQREVLVRDELQRSASNSVYAPIKRELDQLGCALCVPMFLEDRLTGLFCLGDKVNHDMFFVSDLKLLSTLATEVALAVKYRRLEEIIQRKNKLVELGTVAAGVAHEIRNPLSSIRTFAQLLPDKMTDPEFTGDFCKLVIKDVDRITKVIESMLAFARPGQVTVGEHSATELVEEALLLVHPKLKERRIKISKQFHEQPIASLDKQKIMQVLVNLLSNAAEALPEEGRIEVATGVCSVDQIGAIELNGTKKFAVIEIADNGPGIPETVRNRLFDPFFTTKKEGTGLGLSISQKIVRDHGGIITVSSITGKGTTFHINLPLHEQVCTSELVAQICST